MNNLTKITSGEIAEFRPEETKERVSVLKAAIQHAKNMEEWEAGWKAVDLLIEEQLNFVKWWDLNVSKSGPRGGSKVPERGLYLPAEKAEEETGITKQRVSRWRERIAAAQKYREMLFGAAHRKAMADENFRALGGGNNEWYTPEQYIEMARKVLGGIDLDPASSDIANRSVGAQKYFTADQDGLAQEWRGRVWLNPPYAAPLIGQFVHKLVENVASGNVTAAIMLTHNYTDSAWFHEACEIASAICFMRRRVKFVDQNGSECSPTQGQAFFYFGDKVESFAEAFLNIGIIVQPYRGGGV